MAVSDDGRGDAEARLLAVIRRIVQAMPHATAERGRGADASAAATEAGVSAADSSASTCFSMAVAAGSTSRTGIR